MTFKLDPRLAADAIGVGDLALSRVLLMNDARYLWLTLVPRRDNLSEIFDLDGSDRAVLVEEIAAVSRALVDSRGVDKINVGALGNVVRQLHIHVVARRVGDAAWPGPVWGFGSPQRYEPEAARAIVRRFETELIRAARR